MTLKLLKGMLEVKIIRCCTDELLLWFPVIDSSIHIPPFGTLTFNPCTGMPKIPSAHLQRGKKTCRPKSNLRYIPVYTKKRHNVSKLKAEFHLLICILLDYDAVLHEIKVQEYS